MANPYAPPLLDFSPLSKLGDTFFNAYDRGVKRRQEEEAPGLYAKAYDAMSGAGAPVGANAPVGALAQLGQGMASAPTYNPQGKEPAFAAVSGTQPTPKLDPNQAAKVAFDTLVAGGLTPGQAAGFLGNFAEESSFNPKAFNAKEGAIGFAQWRGPRAQALKQFAAANGGSPFDADVQAKFALHEMSTDPQYRDAWQRLQIAQSPQEAADAVIHWEKPGGWKPGDATGVPSYNDRVNHAIRVAQLYGQGSPQAIQAAQAAQADMPAPGAHEAQFQIPGQRGLPATQGATPQPISRELFSALAANPNTRALAGQILAARLKGADVKTVDLGGTIGIMDSRGTIVSEIPKTMGEADRQRIDLDRQRLEFERDKPQTVGGALVRRDGSVVYQAPDKPTIVPSGSTAIGPDGRVIYQGQGGGMFTGNSVDAQALNELVRTGKLTRDQAAQFAAGKTVTGPNGEQLFLTPQGVFSAPAQPQGAAPAPGTVAAAPTGAPREGIVPLTRGKPEKPTEDQTKNRQLYGRAASQLQIAEQNFDSLAEMSGRLGSQLPLGGYLQSEQYQQATNAVKDIAASYLYSVSGATANPGEVENLAATIMPRPDDKPAALADKKTRLRQMVESMKVRAAYPAGEGPAKSYQRGQTATNPTTGEKVIFDGSKWVPLKQEPTTTRPHA